MKYQVSFLLLFLCFHFSVRSQDVNWDELRKEIRTVARTDRDKAIDMLENARKKIAQQQGKGNQDYLECVQELFYKYLSAGNSEKTSELQKEVQLAHDTMVKAQAAVQMEQYQAVLESQQREAQKQAESQYQHIANATYGLDKATLTWADLQLKIQYYIGQGDISTAQSLYVENKNKLPRPEANDVHYIYVISYLTNYYDRAFDAKGARSTYQDAVEMYTAIRTEVEEQYGKNDNRYQQVDSRVKAYEKNVRKYENIGQNKYVYPDPATILGWDELSKLLSSQYVKKRWEDEPYIGIINFYQKVSPSLPGTLTEDYRRALVTVAKSYKKLGRKKEAYQLLDQGIAAFEGRVTNEISENRKEREVEKKMLSALSVLYWERGFKEKKYAVHDRMTALDDYRPPRSEVKFDMKNQNPDKSQLASSISDNYEQMLQAQMAAISQDSIIKYTQAQDTEGLQAYMKRAQQNPEAQQTVEEITETLQQQLKKNPAYAKAMDDAEKNQSKWRNYSQMTQEERLALLNEPYSSGTVKTQKPARKPSARAYQNPQRYEHPVITDIKKSDAYQLAISEEDREKILIMRYRDWGQKSLEQLGSEKQISKDLSINEITALVNTEKSKLMSSAMSHGETVKGQLAAIVAKTTQGQLAIGRNLEVDTEGYNALGLDLSSSLSNGWKEYTRRSTLGDLRSKRVYRVEQDPEKKDLILDSLARNWLVESLNELEIEGIDVPEGLTFDEVMDRYYSAYASHQAEQNDRHNKSVVALNNLVVEMSDFYYQPERLIAAYQRILNAARTRETMQDEEYQVVKELMEKFYGKKNFDIDETAALVARERHPDVAEGSATYEETKNRMISLIEDYDAFMDDMMPGFAEIMNQLDDSGMPLFELLERERLLRDFKSKDDLIKLYLKTYKALLEEEKSYSQAPRTSTNEVNRLEEQGKYRGVLLRILAEAHEDSLQDVFKQSPNFPTYDNLFATKGTGYRTKQFLLDGIKSSNNNSLIQSYEALRLVKDSLGLMNLMTEEERLERGFDSKAFIANYQDVRQKERDIFIEVTRNSNYGKLAERYAVSWKMISNNLKQGEAFVDIERIPHENRDSVKYMFMAIKPNEEPQLHIVSAPFNESIERHYLAYRSAIRVKRTYEEAYQYLWRPIDKLIAGAQKIFISPDGVYHGIAMNGLKNPTNGRFLFEEYEIIRLADISDIKTYFSSSMDSKEEIKSIYLFGNPDYDRLDENEPRESTNPVDTTRSADRSLVFGRKGIFKKLAPLANSQYEIDKIALIAGKSGLQIQTYDQTDASEQNFMDMDMPDIVHLATHGKFYGGKKGLKPFKQKNRSILQENPLLKSHLYLAGANKALKGKVEEANDGVITGEDVAHMDFSETELVVLSACETGLGEQLDGEGVFGLQRSFLTAGAKSIIISLWEVDDRATSLLMTAFYENWLVKNQTRRIAFRNAQQELWAEDKKYRKPYFWSAFVLIGD